MAPMAVKSRSHVVCCSFQPNFSDAYWNMKPSLVKANKQKRVAEVEKSFTILLGSP